MALVKYCPIIRDFCVKEKFSVPVDCVLYIDEKKKCTLEEITDIVNDLPNIAKEIKNNPLLKLFK